MASTASPTLRRRQLGLELKILRVRKGLPAEEAAEAIGSAEATIYRYESGTHSVSKSSLQVLLNLYGVDDPAERARLDALRAEGSKRGWWSGYSSALRPSYQTFIGLEDSAVSRLDFASLVIPGPFQTPDYARAIMATALPKLTADVIDKRIDTRLKRQELITREKDPLAIHAIFDEATILRRVGGDKVWRDQLDHLLRLSARDNITIQVVPFTAGAFADALASFTLLKFPEGEPIAYVEQQTGDLYAEGDDALSYIQRFELLRTEARGPAESAEMIEELLRGT